MSLISETAAIRPTDSHGLRVLHSACLGQRTLDVTFATDKLPVPVTLRIVVPNGYATGDQRYPAIYLLHGGYNDHTQWTDLGAEQTTNDVPVILIQPQGGKGSWFADALEASNGKHPRWETCFITQLLPWVDVHLRTRACRAARAIAGLSMGGYGAMSCAARHPDLFISASSFSGAVDISGALVANWIGVSPLIHFGRPYSIFGFYPADKEKRAAHNPVQLAGNLRGMHLAFYYGNGKAGPLDQIKPTQALLKPLTLFMDWIQEKQVYGMNLRMSRVLKALDIPHDDHCYGNGTHTPAYWARDFQQELPAIMAAFAHHA